MSVVGSSSSSSSSGSASGTPPQGPPSVSTSGSASLTDAVINLSALREQGRKELIDVLDSVRGKKGLVIDPKFSGPLGLVAEVALLREHGVEKIYHLTPGRLDTECTNLIYLVRPKYTFGD